MAASNLSRRRFITSSGMAMAASSLGFGGVAEGSLSEGGEGEPDPSPVRIGLIQMRCDREPPENLAHAVELIARARAAGADVVVLPELFATRYFCRDDGAAEIAASRRDYAVEIPGTTINVLAEAARSNRVVLVGGSVFERAGDTYYNTAVVFGVDGSRLGQYRKTHIPQDPGFWEQHYFVPGDTGVRVFDTPFGKIAVQICYDQWFPELARLAAIQGAEILVYPTAIGDVDHLKERGEGNWQAMWTAAHVGHAVCNNIFVAASNRVGREGPTTFWGGSFASDPCGRILGQGGVGEEVVLVSCDLSLVRRMQESWRFLEERRPDAYKGLSQPRDDPRK